MKTIVARWVVERGNWSPSGNTYINKVKQESTRELQIKIINSQGGDILQFIGGPTGYESYYVHDLLDSVDDNQEICICGGTINSYAACYVDRKEVIDFIKGDKNS